MDKIAKWIAQCSFITLVGVMVFITVSLASKQQRLNEMAALDKQKQDCIDRGDYEGALRALDKQIACSPKDPNLFFRRGLLKVKKLKRFDEGISDIETSAQMAKAQGSLLAEVYQTQSAREYYTNGQYSKGIALYKDAMANSAGTRLGANSCNQFAWLLATCPDATVRDGKLAIQYATTACESTNWKQRALIDTLAAAYAAAGNFSEAIRWQRYAIQMTTSQVESNDYSSRLQLYEAGKVYIETPH